MFMFTQRTCGLNIARNLNFTVNKTHTYYLARICFGVQKYLQLATSNDVIFHQNKLIMCFILIKHGVLITDPVLIYVIV